MKKKLSLILTVLSVLFLAGTITTMVLYFINNSKVNDIEFIELALKSVMEAKELLDYTSMLGWLTIILAILTVILIAGTVVMYLLTRKEKKDLNREETTNENNKQSGTL